MSTHDDFLRDYVSLQPDAVDKWNAKDLHLAAELGKNLLERNKVLENDLKQKQLIIDEQTKEIEHLTKQTAALRSTNDNRIRLSEQLEISVQELESANKRLTVDNAAIKKEMKSLSTYKDTLEARCEELQNALEKLKDQQRQKLHSRSNLTEEEKKDSQGNGRSDADEQLAMHCEELQKQRARDQRKIADLEAELARRLEEVALLEEENACMSQREKHFSLSMQEELSALEEARMNRTCSRCNNEIYEGNERSLLEQEDEYYYSQTEAILQGHKADNPYRHLVEKYDAMMEERDRQRRNSRSIPRSISTNNNLSLQDELKLSGDFNSFSKDPDADIKEAKRGKATPTDFSEVETSSSGFSDETSSKAVQTEDLKAGEFLCTIQDGEDCRFSIYDTLSPIENRFRKTPAYRTLFREIFDILKRTAEKKEEGEPLPLLEDQNEPPKVPPVTPATENLPIDFEDLVSLPDSVVTDTSSLPDDQDVTIKTEMEPSTSGTKDILEFVAIARIKKKKRQSQTPTRRRRELVDINSLVNSAEPSPVGSPSRSNRRRTRRNNPSPAGSHVMTTMQRPQRGDKDREGTGWEYQPFKSTAAQEVAKLKKLEKSYAEVLAYKPPKQRHQPPPYK